MCENAQQKYYANRIETVNGKVACEPFPNVAVEKEVRGGFVVPKQRGTITKMRVVFPSGTKHLYEKGINVWLRSEQFQLQWAKEVFEIEGTKFILVPEDQILLTQRD